MKRESLVFFLGFVIILMPFLGIPSLWKRDVYVGLGILLVLVGYQLRRHAYVRSIEDHTGERKTDVYVEQVEQLFEPTSDKRTVSDNVVLEVKPRRTRMKSI